MGRGMDKSSGRETGRPRRLMMHTESCPVSATELSMTRSGAGDGACAAAVDRHKQAKTERPSAATCNRRKAWALMPASGQASTPAKPPQASNCSIDQAAFLPACTMTSRSSARPAAAQAGPCGCHGGATSASHPPAADNWAKDGKSRLISPTLLRSTRISVKLPRGQPPPGNSASSSAWPLGIALSGRQASVSPRQTSPLASTSAKATGNGVAVMIVLKQLRESDRRQCLQWQIRPHPVERLSVRSPGFPRSTR